jgi:CheY-like chemotaxis protein
MTATGEGRLPAAPRRWGMGASDVLEGVRVLVAEDDGVVALDLAATLEGFGCVVLGPAPTVAETLALLAGGERPDAALLDLGL